MYKLSEVAKKELDRTVKYLSDKGKSITRNNIKMYCDVRYLSDKDIDNADIQKCYAVPYQWAMASKEKTRNCEEALKKVVDYLVANNIELSSGNVLKHKDGFSKAFFYSSGWAQAYLEQKRLETGYVDVNPKSKYTLNKEEKLEAFKKMVDDLVARNIPLSTKNVMGDGTKFSPYYFHDNKEANAYWKEKRIETGYKKTKKTANVPEGCNIEKKESNVHTSKLSTFLVEYVKDVINTLHQEDGNIEISINAIYEAIIPKLNLPVTLEDISNTAEIIDYLFNVNEKVREAKVLKRIRDTVSAMKKEQLLINRFTVLNRCSEFMDYDYLSKHPKAMELIESYI